jgi:hypothetical protein
MKRGLAVLWSVVCALGQSLEGILLKQGIVDINFITSISVSQIYLAKI